jgi:hypothetical protein
MVIRRAADASVVPTLIPIVSSDGPLSVPVPVSVSVSVAVWLS